MSDDPALPAGSEPVGGDAAARARLFDVLARELRQIAGGIHDGRGTLQPTALVNEAFLRLCGGNQPWQDRAHFLRTAARTMRHILIDHKRSKDADKRGGGVRPVPLDETLHGLEQGCGGDVEALHEALEQLGREDAELAEYVELRFFGGRSNAEAAAVLGISPRTGERHWAFARSWLHRRLRP